MLLSIIRLRDFRCLANVEVELDRQVLLIGGNGTGKTSVMEAIDYVFGAGRRSYGFREDDLAAGADELVAEFEIRPDDKTTFTAEEHALFETHVDVDVDGREVVRVRVVAGLEDDGVFRSRGVFFKSDGAEDGLLDADTRAKVTFFYLPAARDAKHEFDDRGGLWSRLAGLLESADDPDKVETLTADAGRELVEAVLGADRLEQLASTVQAFVAVMYGTTPLDAELRATSIDFRTLLRRTELLLGPVGDLAPLEKQSTGLQSLALFGLFRAYLETAGGHLLAAGLEEPEIHLAPHVARSLIRLAAGAGHQVLFTSHAPAVSGMMKVPEIRVLRRPPTGTTVSAVSADLFDAEELARVHRDLRTSGTEFLFARSVLLCEGQSEIGGVPEFARKMGVEFDLIGSSIVSVNGGAFKPYMKLLGVDGFNIPYTVVSDNDGNLEALLKWLDELGLLPAGVDRTKPIGAPELKLLRDAGWFAWSAVDLETYLVDEGGYAHFEAASDFLYGAGHLEHFRAGLPAGTDDAETIRQYAKRGKGVRKPELAAETASRFTSVPTEMKDLIEYVANLATTV
jgi:putative ATP-dependent endonuclease of OLD family